VFADVDVQEMMEEEEEVFADVDVQELIEMEEEEVLVVELEEVVEEFDLDDQKIEVEQMECLGWLQLQSVDPVGDQTVAGAAT